MTKLWDDMYINISHIMSKSTGCNGMITITSQHQVDVEGIEHEIELYKSPK